MANRLDNLNWYTEMVKWAEEMTLVGHENQRLHREINELEKERNALKKDTDRWRGYYDGRLEEIRQLRGRVAELEKQLKHADTLSSRDTDEFIELQQERDRYKDAAEVFERQRNTAREELASAVEDRDEYAKMSDCDAARANCNGSLADGFRNERDEARKELAAEKKQHGLTRAQRDTYRKRLENVLANIQKGRIESYDD